MRTVQVIDRKRGFVNLIVDDTDYDHVRALADITIYFKPKGSVFVKVDGRERSLAVELLGYPPAGFTIDHKNRDKLDFRRTNLRVVNLYVQAGNKGLRKDNKTSFKGVGIDPRTELFFACLRTETKVHYKYRYVKAEDAARAYDELVKQHQPYSTTNEKLGLLQNRS